MGWFEQSVVAPGVTCTVEPFVQSFFRANFYTVRGRDADLQVDFGVGVCPVRAALPLSGAPVIAVATHAHVDHVGGFHEFEDRRGSAVEAAHFAAMDDAGTLQHLFRALPHALMVVPHKDAGDSGRLLSPEAMPPVGVADWHGTPAPQARPFAPVSLADWRLTPAPLTTALDDGDVIDLGDRQFTVLHLPGHSPGSVGLLDEVDGLFLSGDAIYDDDLVDDVPGASVPDYLATMERLRGLDIRLGLGGHGPAFDRRRMVAIAEGYLRAKG
jgi:glyoxylase-like metal-dependent hydrolase (beta-lactamase superfamily II)